MSNQIPIERVKEPLLRCLDETFSKVHGVYLDKGTTFYETLDTITAEEASERISPNSATIAAQVEHVRFYLDVLDNYMRTLQSAKTNWREIWDTVGAAGGMGSNKEATTRQSCCGHDNNQLIR